MTYGVIHGVKHGIVHGIQRGGVSPPGPSWTVDSGSNVALPSNGTEWAAFTAAKPGITALSAPQNLWLMQEASGTLADSIGSLGLTQLGAGHLYQQPVVGWSRLAVQTADGVANQRWNNTTTDAPNPFTTSVALLLLTGFPSAAPAAARGLIAWATNLDAQLSTTPRIRNRCVGINNDTTVSPAGLVLPCLWVYNRTAGTWKFYTSAEKVTGTYNAAVASSNMVAIGGQNSLAGACSYLYGAQWVGAPAEGITDAVAKSLLEGMGYTISWS